MTFSQSYSVLDRLVHKVAFFNPAVQLTAADLDGLLCRNEFRQVKVERPIFITSLPRAGTTLLLELLSRLPEVVTHCYRDMPFILAPMTWNLLTKKFRRKETLRERAHGDGIQIGYDSPEAFEEVIWRVFWPQHFNCNGIDLWSEDEGTGEFRSFFVEHIQKVISLRSNQSVLKPRYVSKNNANLARIGLLKKLFPDSLVVVPFRHPLDQGASLFRQHRRFLDVHRRDSFSKRYMEDIGHLEFGDLHRPICFPGLDEIRRRYESNTLDYWIGYWVAAFEHALSREQDLVFLSYEKLCRGGLSSLSRLCRHLSISDGESLRPLSAAMRAPRSRNEDEEVTDGHLLTRARQIHDRLLELSVT